MNYNQLVENDVSNTAMNVVVAQYVASEYIKTQRTKHDMWDEPTVKLYNTVCSLYTHYLPIWVDVLQTQHNLPDDGETDFDVVDAPTDKNDIVGLLLWIRKMKAILEIHRYNYIRG